MRELKEIPAKDNFSSHNASNFIWQKWKVELKSSGILQTFSCVQQSDLSREVIFGEMLIDKHPIHILLFGVAYSSWQVLQ